MDNNKEIMLNIMQQTDLATLKKVSNSRLNVIILYENLHRVLEQYESENKNSFYFASIKMCKDIISELELDLTFLNSIFESAYVYDFHIYNILIEIADDLHKLKEIVEAIENENDFDEIGVYKFLNKPHVMALGFELIENEVESMMPLIFDGDEEHYEDEY